MEDYLLKRLERINTVMTRRGMADELGVFENTIRNWFKNPGSIKARHIPDIKRLHFKLRQRINDQLEKDDIAS